VVAARSSSSDGAPEFGDKTIGVARHGRSVLYVGAADLGRPIRKYIPPSDERREILLCREVVVDARVLDAHIRGDFPEAEAADTTLLQTPFGSIHDLSLHVAHGPATIC